VTECLIERPKKTTPILQPKKEAARGRRENRRAFYQLFPAKVFVSASFCVCLYFYLSIKYGENLQFIVSVFEFYTCI